MDSMCHPAIQLNEQDRELLVDVARAAKHHAITPARFGYLRRELLTWGKER
jgi:hypothetical protein